MNTIIILPNMYIYTYKHIVSPIKTSYQKKKHYKLKARKNKKRREREMD